MTQQNKTLLFSLIFLATALLLSAQDKKPRYELQVIKKLEPKLKKYASACTVDPIQDIVPTDTNNNGTRLLGLRSIASTIPKDSRSHDYEIRRTIRGQVKEVSNSPMRANEGSQKLPEFIKKNPSLGLLGDKEFDNLLDRVKREPQSMKRIERYRERSKITSTERVHATTLGHGMRSRLRREHSRHQKSGRLLRIRPITAKSPNLGSMLPVEGTTLTLLPRTPTAFSKSNIVKKINHILPKTTDSIKHCGSGSIKTSCTSPLNDCE